MDAGNSKDSDAVSSFRNLAISRRGGVRTRGGRLPPISSREITQVTGSKKVVAPNFPPRRKIIKQEIEFPEERVVKSEPRTTRTRQNRVYLQTEGSFLAQGPAARTKKDPPAYQRCSLPRSTKAAEAGGCTRTALDSDTLKYLMESYDEDEAYVDGFGATPPYRLPLPKEKIPEVNWKLEEGKIKKEIVDIKKEIKTEIEDDESNCPEKKYIPNIEFDSKAESKHLANTFQNVKAEIDDETISTEQKLRAKMDPQIEMKYLAEEMRNVKGDELMLLMQFPKHAFAAESRTSETKSNNSDKESAKEPEQMSTILEKLDEGRVGKLQIMKSGRMKMILGSAEFELLGGSRSESNLEVVSIQMADDGGDLTVLGKIDRKVIVSPIVNGLLPNLGAADVEE